MLSAEDVEQVRFASTKFREGYDQDEVDDMLDRVVATLRRDTSRRAVTADEVYTTTFSSTRFREGYDPDEVDDFLDRVIETLENLEVGPADQPERLHGPTHHMEAAQPQQHRPPVFQGRPTQTPAAGTTTHFAGGQSPFTQTYRPPAAQAPRPEYDELRPRTGERPSVPMERHPSERHPAELHPSERHLVEPGRGSMASGFRPTSAPATPVPPTPAAVGVGGRQPARALAPARPAVHAPTASPVQPSMPAAAVASRLQLARASLPTSTRDVLVVRLPDGSNRVVVDVRSGPQGIEIITG